MPWKVVSDDGSYCVVNKETGKKVPGGCHPTKKEAQAQLRALYANAGPGEKSFDPYDIWEHQVSQEHAEYNPIGGLTGGKACANCQYWENPNGCLIVAGDVSPTGKSKYWEELLPYTPSPMPVVIVSDKASSPDAEGSSPESVMAKITNWVTGLFAGEASSPVVPGGSGLRPVYVTKDANGDTRAWLVGSNNFEDRHGQFIREDTQREYIEWVKETNLYPEFQMWHLGNKSKWGQADTVFRVDNFTVASGPVDPGFEQFAEALAKSKEVGVSHGYYAVLTQDKKEFDGWWPWEFTVMNFADTANVWMGDEECLIREGYMPISEGDKAFLQSKGVPQEFIARLETDISQRSQQLVTAGVGAKATEPNPTPPPENPNPNPGEPKPENPGFNSEALLASIGNLIDAKLQPIATQVETLTAGAKGFEERLSKTQQELVAEHLQSQIGAAAQQGFKASESQTNIINTPLTPQDPLARVGQELDQILKQAGVAG
jgi:hypothetical protein